MRQNYERAKHGSYKMLKHFILHASYLCATLKHKSVFQVPSEIWLWTKPWYKRKNYCTHWKPHLPQRKNCFDHKSIFSEVRGWGPIGRMKLAACKKLKLIWKPFCSNILGNWIIPLGILKPVTMPTAFRSKRCFKVAYEFHLMGMHFEKMWSRYWWPYIRK